MTKPLITEEYRALNAELHGRNGKFGASGHEWEDRVVAELKKVRKELAALGGDPIESYLDYGCGKGQLSAAVEARCAKWEGFKVYRYDPVTHPEEPPMCDFVTCCDVLEHIEPDLLDNVLEDIASKMIVGGLLVISQRPSGKRLADGRNAHLIIEPTEWWMERLSKHFGEMQEVDPVRIKRKINKTELAVLVKPKPRQGAVDTDDSNSTGPTV